MIYINLIADIIAMQCSGEVPYDKKEQRPRRALLLQHHLESDW
jgi:hypothetical protein